ncbi:MAG TPA: putative glycolipid-binding domain-containing protein [Thermoanaerobaculia bacterium]|nr:putative glycolipid-binding domain-containing protein [Thermoanaerobaculia bacterium]
MPSTILWARADGSGHESARLTEPGRIEGSAVFHHERMPVRLDYAINCDEEWATRSASVRGWIGNTIVSLEVFTRGGRWFLNGQHVPEVDGCIDLDLNFSPSTNLLPIRRLRLGVGEEAAVKAAWLRFPSMRFEPLEQTYRRIAADRYQYESAGGAFKAELHVNDAGFPVDYPGGWTAKA